MKLVTDTGIVFVREMRPVIRDPFSLIFSLGQPLVFLALFGPLLTGVPGMEQAAGGSVWQWFVPGILIMIGLFGTSMSGANLLWEMQTGAHERLLVTPLNRAALLVGRALKEIAPLVVQAAIIVVCVMPFGFRLYPLGALAGMLLLAVFGVGIGALSYALAIAAKNREWLFYGVQQTLLFPLLILSGMMLPLESGPGWLRALSNFNPLTYIVDAERALFAGDFSQPSVWQGALAAAVLAAVGLAVGIRSMRGSSG
ncbi:ABC-2 type transport system permease protein [Allonocardiopsis opalescens]|uniref:Transport permease protein n=2 Tax=Allonocardiopsis opalescens TaxID=1144618 RepID=A0A2T0Q5H1_9ACTN|nr:ABC-2 type transport system permease protein [Allonocardiopsis opalescens]